MRANSLDLKKVSIHDSFWSKHVDLVRNAIIPYQWEAMNDRIPDAESSPVSYTHLTLPTNSRV